MATPNLKMMERHLENTVRAALAAQDRLRKARRAAGISHRRTIYTAAEVKSMRLEWYEQWRGMLRAIYNPNPTIKRIAELAVSVHKQAQTAASAKELADKIVAAGETARAGGLERPRSTGRAADILSAGEKRRGLSR